MRTIKEKTCYVPANVLKEDKEQMGRTEEFRLPDGKVIHVRDILTLEDLVVLIHLSPSCSAAWK